MRPAWPAPALVYLLLFIAGVARADTAPADLVYQNGPVYTVDAKDSVAEALAIRAGNIVYVGDRAGLATFIGPRTRVIDLHGRMLMPGLVDAHMHPAEAGGQLLSCNLNYEALTVQAFQARIQACLDADKAQAADRWLTVVNWFQTNMLPPGVEVTRATLDALATRRPILVTSSFGHTSLVNSRALALARITDSTPDPLAGKIVRDAAGVATGLLEDDGQDLVRKQLPSPTRAENLAAARASLLPMRQQGITTFLDAASAPDEIAAYAALERAGELTVRAHFAPAIDPKEGRSPRRAVAAVKAIQRRYDQVPKGAQPRLTVRNAKLFMDGVITAPAFTSGMLTPYFVNAGTPTAPRWVLGKNSGPPTYFPPAVLRPLLAELAKAGIDPHLHADGELAVRESLDGIEAMRARFPGRDLRCAIAHAELVSPSDFPRFGRLDVIPVLSFQWAKPASDTVDGARDYLGPARYAVLEPEGLLVAAGARIAYGSDWPVDPLDEWLALQVGVTRANRPGGDPRYAGRLGEDPGLSRAAALRAITMGSSYVLHEEAHTGSLEVGKWADVIVLDRDFFRIAPEEIADIKVLQTVVGGRVVYESDVLGKVISLPLR